MSTRVIGFNGRVIFARGRDVHAAPVVRQYPVDEDGQPLVPTQPVERPTAPTDHGAVWVSDDGLTYRVVDHMQASDLWASAHTILRWYKLVGFSELRELVKHGVLDAAILVGTLTKRYRVLDARLLGVRLHEIRNPPDLARAVKDAPRTGVTKRRRAL